MSKQSDKEKRKILLQALKVLKQEKVNKGCKSYGFACPQCEFRRMYEMFESYVKFWRD